MGKGLLLVVSGPAGSGKSTVNGIVCQTPGFVRAVSATSRAPRKGEADGVNYYYVSRERFEEMIEQDLFLEHTEFCTNYYGSLKSELEKINTGVNVIFEIEVEGAMNVRKLYPDAILIMLLPPSYSEQEKRLRGRNSETEESIANRLARTKVELEYLPNYDYIVYNETNGADRAAEQILAIARAEQSSVRRNPEAKEIYLAN